MEALPQVGQKYKHKKWGEVEVTSRSKWGRGWRVFFATCCAERALHIESFERLKDFQKATA